MKAEFEGRHIKVTAENDDEAFKLKMFYPVEYEMAGENLGKLVCSIIVDTTIFERNEG